MTGHHGSQTPRDSGIAGVFELLRERAGLVFSEARWPAIERVLQRGRARVGARDWASYRAQLGADTAEFSTLAAELTIGESYFFRDAAQFELLSAEVLSPRIKSKSRSRVRMWSAGCAAGEEPYSLAILWRELGGAPDDVTIVGTDISRSRLAAAERATFTRWSLRGMSDERLRANFVARQLEFELQSPIRAMVEFRHMNLADPSGWPSIVEPGTFDVVMCRNVLIYLDASTVARLAKRLVGALHEDGWLLLGASDPLISDYAACEVVVTSAGLAYRRVKRSSPKRAAQRAEARSKAQREQLRPLPAPPPRPPAPVRPPEQTTNDSGPDRPLDDLLGAALHAHSTANHESAVDLLRTYFAGGGNHLDAHTLFVRSLANRGAIDDALRACSVAAQRYPLSEELAYLESLLLSQARKHAAAAAAARRSIYLDRTLVMGHIALADALSHVGDMTNASRSLRVAQRLLTKLEPAEIVPSSGGESAIRLTAAVAARLAMLEDRS